MLETNPVIQKLHQFGVGRRRLDDDLFSCDRAPARLGIYDEDEEDLYYQGVAPAGGYRCGACRRALPSPHLLDLHLQETHDSFFAATAARKPSYCCYIQECPDKFANTEERLEHCIQVHKLPKDFRFEMKSKAISKPKKKIKSQGELAMEVEVATAAPAAPAALAAPAAPASGPDTHKFAFHNSKQKGLIKYSGKTFTSNKGTNSARTPDMDQIMSDLKQNLPK